MDWEVRQEGRRPRQANHSRLLLGDFPGTSCAFFVLHLPPFSPSTSSHEAAGNSCMALCRLLPYDVLFVYLFVC